MPQHAMLTRRTLLLAGGAAALPLSAIARAPRWPAMTALLDTWVGEGRLPGMSVAVKRPGAPVHFLNRGAVGFGRSQAFDERTFIRVYSMTKPVTGIAVMQLVDRGRIPLRESIGGVVPELAAMPVFDAAAAGGTRPAKGVLSALTLMTHSSGVDYFILPDTEGAAMQRALGIWPGARGPVPGLKPGLQPAQTLEEMVLRLKSIPLTFDPLTRWRYSIGLDVLGLAIERAGGRPLDRYFADEIFAPLEMRETSFAATSAARLADVHTVAKDGAFPVQEKAEGSPFLTMPRLLSGGGGLVSTTWDWTRLCQALLDRGGRILSRRAHATATADLLPPNVREFQTGHGFGAGMRVVMASSAAADGSVAGAYGWGGAAGTIFWVDPKNRAYCVACPQLTNAEATPLRAELRKAFYADLAA
jgi:CubicO group peptidase (beta-lactamase class C family)